MKAIFSLIVLAFVALTSARHAKQNLQGTPPHCTQLTKDTDFTANFKFDYPTVYIPVGQQEVFQPLHCTNPPTVSQAVSRVCDWAAPPLVQFTLEDEFLHVYRQDPAGQYAGSAVVMTYQKCNHNIPSQMAKKSNITIVEML